MVRRSMPRPKPPCGGQPYLAMVDITKKWTGRQQDWSVIHAQLSIYFAERMPE